MTTATLNTTVPGWLSKLEEAAHVVKAQAAKVAAEKEAAEQLQQAEYRNEYHALLKDVLGALGLPVDDELFRHGAWHAPDGSVAIAFSGTYNWSLYLYDEALLLDASNTVRQYTMHHSDVEYRDFRLDIFHPLSDEEKHEADDMPLIPHRSLDLKYAIGSVDALARARALLYEYIFAVIDQTAQFDEAFQRRRQASAEAKEIVAKVEVSNPAAWRGDTLTLKFDLGYDSVEQINAAVNNALSEGGRLHSVVTCAGAPAEYGYVQPILYVLTRE